ncbi:MAG: hypothetical protein AVDCRST_MAG39-1612, partial [uncultured Sphingomonadaceae bacterium]
ERPGELLDDGDGRVPGVALEVADVRLVDPRRVGETFL